MSNPGGGEGKGCLYSGCLATIIGLVGLLVISGFFVFGSYFWAKSITAETPLEFPAGDEEIGSLAANKMKLFGQVLENGVPVPLVLTADEVNGYFQLRKKFKGKFHVELPEDKIFLALSIPLESMPLFDDRHLNVETTFQFDIAPGKFSVIVDSLSADGDPLPEWIRKEINRHNLIEEIKKNNPSNGDKAVAIYESISNIEVVDGQIFIYPAQ